MTLNLSVQFNNQEAKWRIQICSWNTTSRCILKEDSQKTIDKYNWLNSGVCLKKQLSFSPKLPTQRDRFVCYAQQDLVVFDLEGWPKTLLILAKFNSTWHTADCQLLWTTPANEGGVKSTFEKRKNKVISLSADSLADTRMRSSQTCFRISQPLTHPKPGVSDVKPSGRK